MKINFTVHGVSQSEETKTVDVEGEKVSARVPCTEVELVTDDPSHGSITLRFRGAAAQEAASVFKKDGHLTWEPRAAGGA